MSETQAIRKLPILTRQKNKFPRDFSQCGSLRLAILMQQCGVRFFRYFHFNSDAPTDQVLLWSSNQNIDWGFVLLSSSSLQQQAKH
jgi:hypothetical protein